MSNHLYFHYYPTLGIHRCKKL